MLSSQTHQLIYYHVAVSKSVGLVGESKVRPIFFICIDEGNPSKFKQFEFIFDNI